jgi:hypothetical protein
MPDSIDPMLQRIEQGVDRNGAALAAHTAIFETLMRQLGEIISLLTPEEADPDKPSLGDLLAHLIMQNQEQLTLTHRIVEAMNRLERTVLAELARPTIR